MKTARPASFAVWAPRVTLYALACALLTPILAFWIRGAPVDLFGAPMEAHVYIVASLLITTISLWMFSADHTIHRYFTLHDIIQMSKAVIFSVALTATFVFAVTRMDAVPRSIPIIHATLLILALSGRGMYQRWCEHNDVRKSAAPHAGATTNIVIVNANRMAKMYIALVEGLGAKSQRILCVLDEQQKLINRTIGGYAIIGQPSELTAVIQDYAIHGVIVHKVMVAGNAAGLNPQTRLSLARSCEDNNASLEFFGDILNFAAGVNDSADFAEAADEPTTSAIFARNSSFFGKRLFDVAVAAGAAVFLSPLIVLTGTLVAFDVGWPLLFWQQRLGKNGSMLRIYKFRSLPVLRPSTDAPSDPQPQPSRIGALLRAMRLDELPQIWHVARGEMSIVGPRPLLPCDQPEDASLRLSVPPGLTGWAQVCGGKLLNVEEKNALDLFYIRHAGLMFDLKIVLLTIRTVVFGERRNEKAIRLARRTVGHRSGIAGPAAFGAQATPASTAFPRG